MVLVLIEVVVALVYVEKTIGAQPERLANLEVEAYFIHSGAFFRK